MMPAVLAVMACRLVAFAQSHPLGVALGVCKDGYNLTPGWQIQFGPALCCFFQ